MIIDILFFIIIFILTFSIFFFNFCKKLKRKNIKKISELTFLITRFNLNKKKLNYQRILFVVSIINAFIISFVATVIYLIPVNYALSFFIAFLLLIALIYSLYEIYGRHLQRKWGRDNEQ